MQKQLALVADAANISADGKLNILGEFETIWAVAEPATHPALWFVAKLLFDATDVGQHRVMLLLVDDDGNAILPPLTGKLDVPAPSAGSAGEGRSMPVVLGMQNLTLPKFGTYTFELRIDDRTVAEVPLHLRKLQAPSAED